MGFQQPIVKISSVSFGYSSIVFSLSSLLFYWYTTKGSLTCFIFYLFFLLPWAIFLVLSLFFLYSCSFHFLYLFFICSLLPFPPQRSLLFFSILLLLHLTLSQPFLDPLLLLSLPFLLFSSNQTHFFYF